MAPLTSMVVAATIVARVTSQAAVDPSSASQNSVGSGYGGFKAPNQGGPRVPVPSSLQASQGRGPKYFDPMAAAAQAPPPNDFDFAGNPVAAAVASAMHGSQAPLKGLGPNAPTQMAAAPKQSGDFLSGFLQGYLQKTILMPGELTCLKANVHKFGQDAVSLVTEVIGLVGSLLANQQANYLMLMNGAGQVVDVVTSTQKLMGGCVKTDALIVMNITLQHLQNPTYVKGRLLANGIDIARVLADAVPAVGIGNFVKVGQDFGTLVRKILLSRNSGPVRMVLPEGVQPAQVGETVVNGIIEGLFRTGSNLTITSTSDSSIDIFVDLHRCIAKEAPDFSRAMNALYLAMAQIATNLEQWQLRQKGIQMNLTTQPPQRNWMSQLSGFMGNLTTQPSQTNWMSQLSGLMENIPVLMNRCGVTIEQRAMMSRAIKSMDTVQMYFGVPGPSNKTVAGIHAAQKFELATQAWKHGQYQQFGLLLGGIMRDLLLVVYPQKYHVDESGFLRAYIDKENMFGQMGDIAHDPVRHLPLLFGACACLAVVGFAVARAVRPRPRIASLLRAEAVFEPDLEAPHHGVDFALE